MSQNNNNVQEEWPVHNSQSADGPSMRGRVPFVAAFKFQLNIFDWGIRDFFLLLLLLLLLFIVGWLPFLLFLFFYIPRQNGCGRMRQRWNYPPNKFTRLETDSSQNGGHGTGPGFII